MMKKIWALVLAVAVFATMTGCGKNSSNAEEAAVRDEIMSELSEEDKKEIREMQNDLNDEPTPGEENKEKEEFTADDFPCDPMMLNAKWSDGYVQITDVIVQEFHRVPITEVIKSFEDSKLEYKLSDDDYYGKAPNLDDEFPINSESEIICMKSDGYISVYLCCYVERGSDKDKIIKWSDAYFDYVSSYSASNDFYPGDSSVCAYLAKGFPWQEDVVSEYSYRDVDKILDDDMIEVQSDLPPELNSYLDKEDAESLCFYKLDLNEHLPLKIIFFRRNDDGQNREKFFDFLIRENNRLYVKRTNYW